MNDETKNTENDNAEDKDTKSNTDLIGVDPLAWLSDEEKQSVIKNITEDATTVVSGVAETSKVEAEVVAAEESVEQPVSQVEANDSSNTPCYIKLQSAISIRNITELMDQLNQINQEETELVFECDQVEKVDAASLQLLLGYYLFAIEAGKTVTWNSPPDAFYHGVELLGMKDIIKLPAKAA